MVNTAVAAGRDHCVECSGTTQAGLVAALKAADWDRAYFKDQLRRLMLASIKAV